MLNKNFSIRKNVLQSKKFFCIQKSFLQSNFSDVANFTGKNTRFTAQKNFVAIKKVFLQSKSFFIQIRLMSNKNFFQLSAFKKGF